MTENMKANPTETCSSSRHGGIRRDSGFYFTLPLVRSNSTKDVCTSSSIGSTKSGLRRRTLKPFHSNISSWIQQRKNENLSVLKQQRSQSNEPRYFPSSLFSIPFFGLSISFEVRYLQFAKECTIIDTGQFSYPNTEPCVCTATVIAGSWVRILFKSDFLQAFFSHLLKLLPRPR